MQVTIFENIKNPRPFITDLDKIAEMMKHSPKLCNRTIDYRETLAAGYKDIAKEKKIRRFPAFSPCADFIDGIARKHVVGLTGLCYLDFDHVDNLHLIDVAMNKLRNDLHVVMASKSVSGNGLHILIRYKIVDLHTPVIRARMRPSTMQKWYKKAYDIIAVEYEQIVGFKADKQAGHIEHLYIVSYAPDLYYNPDAEPRLVDTRI